MAVDLEYNMKYGQKFVNFIEQGGFHLTKSGKIKESTFESPIAAKTYIGITKILYLESRHEGTILNVCYQSYDGSIEDDIDVTVSYSRKIHLNFEEVFEKIRPTIKSGYETALRKIYKTYFTESIQCVIKTTPALISQCGWFYDEKDLVFKSINLRNDDVYYGRGYDGRRKIEKIIFNGLFTSKEFQNITMEEYCKTKNSINELLSFLVSDGNVLTIFTYCIHSILWQYLCIHKKFEHENIPNTDTAIFSLCIYGKNIPLAKAMANLFVNLFDIPKNTWEVIIRTVHISATSLSDNKFVSLESYQSVPIIVTSKSNTFNKASSIIRKIQSERIKKHFQIFPVYISQSPIYADEMINCCIDAIPLDIKNKEKLSQMHYDFCFLIYHFICYLTRISNPTTDDDVRKHNMIKNWLNDFFQVAECNPRWLDSHLPDFLMLVSLYYFSIYLEQTPLKEYSEKLTTKFTSHINSVPVKNEPLAIAQEINYLKLISSFLKESIQNPSNDSWIFEGVEQRDDKESCYYLEPKNGLQEFNHYLSKKKLGPVNTRKFLNILKEERILKLPNAGKSNTLKRRGKYVYALIKDSLL